MNRNFPLKENSQQRTFPLEFLEWVASRKRLINSILEDDALDWDERPFQEGKIQFIESLEEKMQECIRKG